MNVTMFNRPDRHPQGMLRGYRHHKEKESMLLWMLIKSQQQGSFDKPIETRFEHPQMVEEGLLERVGWRSYRLTEKALILLHAHFGKTPVAEVAK